MLKFLTIAVAGVLTAVTLKRVIEEWNKARIGVKAKEPEPRAVTRLKQDPRTGVYYPEG